MCYNRDDIAEGSFPFYDEFDDVEFATREQFAHHVLYSSDYVLYS